MKELTNQQKYYRRNKEYWRKYAVEKNAENRIKLGKKYKPRGEYCLRILVNNKGKHSNVYGLTIPANIVKKHKLLGKVFKINVSPKGKFILYTKK